ncbi:MAG: carbamoyl-phosphate synthase large subunit [Planctomycetota bacterium]
MPKRDDIRTILIVGSGPIVIGQGCEFDYSGTQACKALHEEGYRIVLVNSNPATIMTDPEMSDRTYIEPITPEAVAKVIARERPDALLPTLGGQTGLNTAAAVHDSGVLEEFGVELIGATREVIHRAEDRTEFKNVCLSAGLDVPASGIAHSMDEARRIVAEVGVPCCIRPAYTLGGSGGGFAFNIEEFEQLAQRGLDASPISEILIEESVLGWKEYELEVMRDRADNVVIVCSIENIDAMGVHTGDSITVAPAQTLTDKEYQRMRDAAVAVIRAVGVETGGSNIQFAVNPADGRMVVIEMNPRVSRSSALASKATGFPIAKIAAKLAVGYTLDEIPNDITRKTPACFEPTIDYVVTKIPRWTFEKFPDADETLTTQMKSVGEGMSIGRTFKESLQKGIRSMEVKRYGLGLDDKDKWLAAQRRRAEAREPRTEDKTAAAESSALSPRFSALDVQWPVEEGKLRRKLAVPAQGRLYYVRYAFKMGWTVQQVHELTWIDPWFLAHIKQLVDFEDELTAVHALEAAPPALLRKAKQWGYSDIQLARVWRTTPEAVRLRRQELNIRPVYKLVDTCAAEFEAYTPYYYSTYESPFRVIADEAAAPTSELRTSNSDDEVRVSDKKKIVILGGGPNRIGQGIEFDYCCVHAVMAAKEMGYEAVMVNSNPETVSTDYDTSDMLFFEPLTLEDVLNICEKLNGKPLGAGSAANSATQAETGRRERGLDRSESPGRLHGVIVQLGGQTPLNLARGLEEAGVPIIGTSPESIDLAEDRKRFGQVLAELGLKCPAGGTAFSIEQAHEVAARIGYPVLVRPSYVLGGRAMEIVSDEAQLDVYMEKAVDASTVGRDHPILIDKFLAGATEVDVDCLADFGPTRAERSAPARGEPASTDRPRRARAVICGVMEHIEEAGVHSGDSACALPPFSLSDSVVAEIERQARLLAERLEVRGLMNIQFAVRDGQVYILEVNPRASRTVPFVSKATGTPWAKLAAKVMAGETLEDLGVSEAPRPAQTSVKESVFPFGKFPGVDVILGPEMRSTGEVMGVDMTFSLAFAKSQMAAGLHLPTGGTVFLSVRDADKPRVAPLGQRLAAMGFALVATDGTHKVLADAGVRCRRLAKLAEGRPNIADLMANGEVALLINTPTRRGPTTDEGRIRALATLRKVPLITTLTAARAAVDGIAALRAGLQGAEAPADAWGVRPLQDYFPD